MVSASYRLAVKDDLDFILDGIAQICRIENDSPPDRIEGTVRSALRGGRVIMAEISGRPVGFIHFRFSDKVPYGIDYGKDALRFCWVEWMYVERRRRRRGIGSGLFRELSKACRKEKVRRIMLDVFRVNEKARAFYDRHGCREVLSIMELDVS